MVARPVFWVLRLFVFIPFCLFCLLVDFVCFGFRFRVCTRFGRLLVVLWWLLRVDVTDGAGFGNIDTRFWACC